MVHKIYNSDKLFNVHVHIKFPAEDNYKLKC
jgi:hypothetical protein